MRKPYTDNQFKVLAAAFRGNYNTVSLNTRRATTRAINDMLAQGLVSGDRWIGGDLTASGLRAYVDMCERYDADSGCLAFAERAREARIALRSTEAK